MDSLGRPARDGCAAVERGLGENPAKAICEAQPRNGITLRTHSRVFYGDSLGRDSRRAAPQQRFPQPESGFLASRRSARSIEPLARSILNKIQSPASNASVLLSIRVLPDLLVKSDLDRKSVV